MRQDWQFVIGSFPQKQQSSNSCNGWRRWIDRNFKLWFNLWCHRATVRNIVFKTTTKNVNLPGRRHLPTVSQSGTNGTLRPTLFVLWESKKAGRGVEVWTPSNLWVSSLRILLLEKYGDCKLFLIFTFDISDTIRRTVPISLKGWKNSYKKNAMGVENNSAPLI